MLAPRQCTQGGRALQRHPQVEQRQTRLASSARPSQQQATASTPKLETRGVNAPDCSTHRRGLLQGLLGTAALTSLPPSASDAAAGAAKQQTASAAGPPASSTPNAPSMPAQGASTVAALADADAAAAGSSSSCSAHNPAAATAARDPAINRGCATTPPARQQLSGLIPPRQVDLSVEVMRARTALEQCSNDLEKHRLLISLKESNRAAFIALLQEDLEGLLPLVYTPVIADACRSWGTLLPRPLGLYVAAGDDPVEVVSHWPSSEVKVVVITDGERILGLGDLGAHGMGIPTGKCNVYTAAGISPDWLLPITVDVGTDNASLRSDVLYVGLPEQRLRGPRYFGVMEGVVNALKLRYGERVVVHWEDLAVGNAFQMLQRTAALGLPTFNDDIQCTAAVALAALLGATAVPGVLPLQSQTFCFFGAGQANLGVAQLLVKALQRRGLSQAAAKSRIWMVDSKGLIMTDRPSLSPQKAQFARDPSQLRRKTAAYNSSSGNGRGSVAAVTSSSAGRGLRLSSSEVAQQLADIVEAVQPTALIGAAAVPGAFGRPVLENLVKATQAVAGPSSRPLVFALSNPTDQAEVSFEEALQWTGGRAVYASGSPFAAITTPTGRTLRPAQANNCFVFPGLAQGILASGVQSVDDSMLLLAAEAIAGMLTKRELEEECVLPHISRLPEVTERLAAAVTTAR